MPHFTGVERFGEIVSIAGAAFLDSDYSLDPVWDVFKENLLKLWFHVKHCGLNPLVSCGSCVKNKDLVAR